jgi:hypothetical protein
MGTVVATKLLGQFGINANDPLNALEGRPPAAFTARLKRTLRRRDRDTWPSSPHY